MDSDMNYDYDNDDSVVEEHTEHNEQEEIYDQEENYFSDNGNLLDDNHDDLNENYHESSPQYNSEYDKAECSQNQQWDGDPELSGHAENQYYDYDSASDDESSRFNYNGVHQHQGKRKTNSTICLTRLTQTQFTQRNQQLQIQLKQQRRQLDVQHRDELWKLMQSEVHLYNHRQHDFILARQEKEHALLVPD